MELKGGAPYQVRQKEAGFTLIDVIIVLAIIGTIAGILTPTIARYINNSKIRRATVDVKNIGSAVGDFFNDLGDWPIWANGQDRRAAATKISLLTGPGNLPTQTGAPGAGNIDTLENQLLLNAPNGDGTATNRYPNPADNPGERNAWRGPYIEQVRSDPWGNAYLVSVRYLWPENISNNIPVIVLSAGPDGNVDTDFEQPGLNLTIGGDDIVFRIK
jgi:type II secretory pathway pseudopilin PulG